MKLIYCSPLPWASFSQRPHKFVEWFNSEFRCDVLWIDPYPTRLPMLKDLFPRKNIGSWEKSKLNAQLPSWLSVISPTAFPIEPIPCLSSLNVLLWKNVFHAIDKFVDKDSAVFGIGKPTELALRILNQTPRICSFYDSMDDFPAFYQGLSRSAMHRRDGLIAAGVDYIFVSADALVNRFVAHSSKISVVLNACATETLPNLRDVIDDSKAPVIGYIGTIGYWFDWSLVIALAQANPMACLRLVGPVYNVPKVTLPRNIELIPPCDHHAAMLHMQDFSVGLIPFKINELTASVDPIKYYEYRAMGLPVLSTDFGQMSLRKGEQGIFVMDGNSDLSALVKIALAYNPGMDEILEFRSKNSWSDRFSLLKEKFLPN